jgi:hypothetical protein
MAFTIGTTIFGDIGNPIHHQHGRLRQLRVAFAKQLAPRTFQQIITIKLGWKIRHTDPQYFCDFETCVALRQTGLQVLAPNIAPRRIKNIELRSRTNI